MGGVDFRRRKRVDVAVTIEHVVQRLAPVVRIGVENLRRPDLVRCKPLRELHELPEVRARLSRRLHELVPDMRAPLGVRSEEHTSELQSLMRISYAVLCLKKKTK